MPQAYTYDTSGRDEALRIASELGGTGERAEVVRRAFEHEAPGGVVGIDRHLADRVDRQRAVAGRSDAHGGEQLDRLANVAQRVAAARLVVDAVDRGSERGCVAGDQHLAARRLRGDARG